MEKFSVSLTGDCDEAREILIEKLKGFTGRTLIVEEGASRKATEELASTLINSGIEAYHVCQFSSLFDKSPVVLMAAKFATTGVRITDFTNVVFFNVNIIRTEGLQLFSKCFYLLDPSFPSNSNIKNIEYVSHKFTLEELAEQKSFFEKSLEGLNKIKEEVS